jgi:outer membrane protein
MKCFLLFIFILLNITFPLRSYSAEYSLDDLYELALEISETIKIAEEDLYISEREKDRSVAELIPTLSAFGQHTRYSDKKISSEFLLQPEHTNEWGLRLGNTYSLGGREFTALDISKQGIEQSRYDLHAVREDYLMGVAVQYYDVLRSKREIEIAAANVQRLTTERDAAKRRLEVGTAIKTALLRAEAELADAQSELIRAENVLKVAKNILSKTVGIREEYTVREPLEGVDYTLPEQGEIDLSFLVDSCEMSPLDCLKKLALTNRAEIRSLATLKEIAEENIEIAKSTYWPDLSIEGVYAREKNEPSRTFELDERIYGMLKLDFPFFEGGLKKAEVRKAQAQLRQAEYSLSDLKREIRVEVENSYIVATTAASVLKPRKAEVEFGKENYSLVSKQFQYGLADSVDVMDANTRLVTSERELLNAQYVYVLEMLRLKRVTGMLLTSVVGNQPSEGSENTERK